MSLRLVIALQTTEDIAREWDSHLSQGGAFVRGASAERAAACTVVLVAPSERELELSGRVVFASGDGVGVQLDGFGAELRDRIHAFLHTSAEASDDDDDDDDDPERDPLAKNVYERIRNLPMAQQLKLSREGEL